MHRESPGRVPAPASVQMRRSQRQGGSMRLITASDQQHTTTSEHDHAPPPRTPTPHRLQASLNPPLAARRVLCPEPHPHICPSLRADLPTAPTAGLSRHPPHRGVQAYPPSPGSPSSAWLPHPPQVTSSPPEAACSSTPVAPTHLQPLSSSLSFNEAGTFFLYFKA